MHKAYCSISLHSSDNLFNVLVASAPCQQVESSFNTPFTLRTTSLNSSDDMKEESTFNVEDLVKKIDAKIAELEEEERKEQQEKKQNDNMVEPNLNDLINNNEPIKDAVIEEKSEVTKKEGNKVSDDAFFDDFFSDD